VSQVKTLRADEQDWLRWRKSAEREGLSLNAWATRALNHVATIEEALARQKEMDESRGSQESR